MGICRQAPVSRVRVREKPMRFSPRTFLLILSLAILAASSRRTEAAAVRPVPYLGLGHTLPITTAAWSPDGKTLATGASDSVVMLWDVVSRRPRATLSGYTGRFSPSPAIS